jgi:hypothetical protein
MRKWGVWAVLAGPAVATGLMLARPGVAAAQEVTYEACVVERRPTAALMQHVADRALFELDLRGIPGTPFALRPEECVTVTGRDRGGEPGLRREFPQAGWLIEAWAISDIQDHVNRGSEASHD